MANSLPEFYHVIGTIVQEIQSSVDELVKNDNILHLVQSQRLDNVRCCKYYALDICKFPDMIHRENSYVHDRWTSHVCHICKSALQVMANHPAIQCKLLAKLDEKRTLVPSSSASTTSEIAPSLAKSARNGPPSEATSSFGMPSGLGSLPPPDASTSGKS